MESTEQNRTPMTCPICYKTDKFLATHLRRKCMKYSSAEQIKDTLAEAKKNLVTVASKGLAVNYKEVTKLVCGGTCLESVLSFLAGRGFIIYNQPPKPRRKSLQVKEMRCQGRAQRRKDCPSMTMEKSNDCDEKSQSPEDKTSEEEEEAMEVESVSDPIHPLRKKMAEAGMYRRHPLDSELISGFSEHLSKTMTPERCKLEADQIARFLYYMDNKKPSLNFIYKISKVHDYIIQLRRLGNSNLTLLNYYENLLRLMDYLLEVEPRIFKKQPSSDQLWHFNTQLLGCVKVVRRRVSSEKAFKKQDFWLRSTVNIIDFGTLLRFVKPSIEKALEKAESGEDLMESDRWTVVGYLESLLVFRHPHEAEAIQNMTVNEWKTRCPFTTNGAVEITVHDQDVGSNQIASLIVLNDEERWFDIYYKKVRPTLLKSKKDITNFFISSTGEKIQNVFTEIKKLCARFGISPVTGRESAKSLGEMEKDVTRPGEKAFRQFTEKYPLSTVKAPPPFNVCCQESKTYGQNIYNRWRKAQNRMRVEHVIGCLQDHEPNEEEVKQCIAKQPWKKNLPRVRDVIQQWKKK